MVDCPIPLNITHLHKHKTKQPYVAPYFGIQTGPWPFEPAHVVGIREKRWKIAMYYDPAEPVTRTPPQWEFYDMKSDPQGMYVVCMFTGSAGW